MKQPRELSRCILSEQYGIYPSGVGMGVQP